MVSESQFLLISAAYNKGCLPGFGARRATTVSIASLGRAIRRGELSSAIFLVWVKRNG